MKKEAKEKMGVREEARSECPICMLLDLGSQIFGKESEFYRHMINARIEFLQGIKSLIDSRIESLEKAKEKPRKKRFTKIEVEE